MCKCLNLTQLVKLTQNYVTLLRGFLVNLGVLMKYILLCCALLFGDVQAQHERGEKWLLIDNFESSTLSSEWQRVDSDNQTSPHIPNPQVTEVLKEENNYYLLKKPAAEGVVGNRKALTFRALPTLVEVGQTYTFFIRFRVEYFPNNHSFGLSNMSNEEIIEKSYDAFEPMLRITDKAESDGRLNDGTLMVSTGFKQYTKIIDPDTGRAASPLEQGRWYELWYVVNNSLYASGGQRFDVYLRGGQFEQQAHVYSGAEFRMQREQSLSRFFMISNTGSKSKPYGNGGVMYDDLYMAKGTVLTDPRIDGIE